MLLQIARIVIVHGLHILVASFSILDYNFFYYTVKRRGTYRAEIARASECDCIENIDFEDYFMVQQILIPVILNDNISY
jgi:hypothetical protein